MDPVFVLCCIVGISLCPWCRIALSLSNAVSSWNQAPVEEVTSHVVALRRSTSEALQDRLLGGPTSGRCMAVIIFLYFLLTTESAPRQRLGFAIGFVMCFFPSFLYLSLAWLKFGRGHGVRWAQMMIFFAHSATFGLVMAIFLNSSEMVLWTNLATETSDCYLNHIRNVTDFTCNEIVYAEWLLTPGLVEETWKAIWLFWRLRRSEDEVPEQCCGCFRVEHGSNCGARFFNLAPTPYHVILCAMACGAGFQCMENLAYTFSNDTIKVDPLTGADMVDFDKIFKVAIVRMFTSFLHVLWSTRIGLGLAKRMFLPESQRPWLLSVLLPSMALHAAWDFAMVGITDASRQAADGDMVAPRVFMLYVYVLIGDLTLSLLLVFGAATCCCFCCCRSMATCWEDTYASEDPGVFAREPADTAGPAVFVQSSQGPLLAPLLSVEPDPQPSAAASS